MKTKIVLILMISGLIVFRSTSKFSADVTDTTQNGSIVFVGGDGQLYTVMPDGSRRKQLTQPPSNNAFPAVSGWKKDCVYILQKRGSGNLDDACEWLKSRAVDAFRRRWKFRAELVTGRKANHFQLHHCRPSRNLGHEF